MDIAEIERAIIDRSQGIPPRSPCELMFSDQTLFPLSVVEWEVNGPRRSRLILDKTISSSERLPFFARRLACVLQLLEAAHSTGKLRQGSVLINLNDNATKDGIAFCSDSEGNLLVPDPEFIFRNGYQAERERWSYCAIPWAHRLPVAFWRGGTSGQWPKGDWRKLPRLDLCRKAKSRSDLFDVGISQIAQLPDGADEAISSEGLMRTFIPSMHLNCYKYHIDIDGNTNAWASFFLKLLSGSPVLKVSSPGKFRQWYYSRLQPWEHFVPVDSSMDDLIEKAVWLRNHQDEAERIGQAGRSMATALTYEAEVLDAGLRIAAHLRDKQFEDDTDIRTIATDIMQKIHGADIYAGFSPGEPVDSQGWNSSHPVVAELIRKTRPDVIIDVGVWKGGSTLFLARLLRDEKINGAVIAVDTFLGSLENWIQKSPTRELMVRRHGLPTLYEQLLTNMVQYGVHSYVIPLPQTSVIAARLLEHFGIRAGLVHIDASHEYDAVLQDARAYWPILRPGGYLIGDDYGPSWPGVVQGADAFANEAGVALEVHPPKWFIRKPV